MLHLYIFKQIMGSAQAAFLKQVNYIHTGMKTNIMPKPSCKDIVSSASN